MLFMGFEFFKFISEIGSVSDNFENPHKIPWPTRNLVSFLSTIPNTNVILNAT